MEAKLARAITEIRPVNTKNGCRYLATILLLEGKHQYWMSPKQAERLSQCADVLSKHDGYSNKRCECHIVVDGERFVWCGTHTATHSDLQFLNSSFGVDAQPAYSRLPHASGEAHESLKD